MGRMRESTEEETTATLTEALLLTTMCIIGLPVEVHVKDGSIFSGIFHTASVDEDYGVVLKKASLVRKGTHYSNVSGGLIDTLFVLPEDLVQVVAKGVMVPAEDVSSWPTSVDKETVSETVGSCQTSEIGAVSAPERRNRNQDRQVGVTMHQEGKVCYRNRSEALNEVPKVNVSSTNVSNASLSSSDASLDVKHVNQPLGKELRCKESVASEVSDSAKTQSVMSQNPLNNTAQESKLNPSAKNFSPSISNRSTPTPMPMVPRVAYEPDSIPTVQVAGAQPGFGIRPNVPLPSWPVGFLPYAASTGMNADSLQYNQPIAGHIFPRAQPIGHGAQYQPVQALPPHLHLDPHNGMFGRHGQLVYVNQFTHDVFQASAPRSQIPPPFLISHGVAMNEGIQGGPLSPASMTSLMVDERPQPSTMRGDIHPPSLQPRSSRSSVSTRGFITMQNELHILFRQRRSSRSRFPTRGFNTPDRR